MKRPGSVVGCSTCGALYSPIPGDGGRCPECRHLPAVDLALETDPGQADAPPERARPLGGDFNRGGPGSAARPLVRPRRGLRRSAIAFIVLVLLAAGGAAAAIYQRRLQDLWAAARRQSPADAWAAARTFAEHGWSAIRRRLPFELPQSGEEAARASVKLSQESARASRKGHDRAKAVAKK